MPLSQTSLSCPHNFPFRNRLEYGESEEEPFYHVSHTHSAPATTTATTPVSATALSLSELLSVIVSVLLSVTD